MSEVMCKIMIFALIVAKIIVKCLFLRIKKIIKINLHLKMLLSLPIQLPLFLANAPLQSPRHWHFTDSVVVVVTGAIKKQKQKCRTRSRSRCASNQTLGWENYPNHLSLQSYFVVYDLYNKPNKRLKKIPLNHSRQSISLSPNNPTPSLNQIPIPNPKHTSLRLNLKSSPTACWFLEFPPLFW